MKKIYVATMAAAVGAAIVGGILLTQFNGISASNTATLSQNHQGSTGQSITQNTKGDNDGDNNFGPPDDGGFGGMDQLLG